MNPYKVGDLVRCRDPGSGNGLVEGEAYTVESVGGDYIHPVNSQGQRLSRVYHYRFDLIKSADPTTDLSDRTVKAMYELYTVVGKAKLDFGTNKVNAEGIDFDRFHDAYMAVRSVLAELGLVPK